MVHGVVSGVEISSKYSLRFMSIHIFKHLCGKRVIFTSNPEIGEWGRECGRGDWKISWVRVCNFSYIHSYPLGLQNSSTRRLENRKIDIVTRVEMCILLHRLHTFTIHLFATLSIPPTSVENSIYIFFHTPTFPA